MIKIEDKEQCCGCASCIDNCPKRCISFQIDSDGFRYPVVNTEFCIECHLCEKYCPAIQKNMDSNIEQSLESVAYAARNNSEQLRMSSSSGGIFSLIANWMLNVNGIIVGAVLTKDMKVQHCLAENENSIKQMYGSKYLQSNLTGVYNAIHDALKKERSVLFTGTPCQCAAIRKRFAYPEKLTVVDIICHGVPSEKVWNKYLEEKEALHKSQIVSVSFRAKNVGWADFGMELKFSNGQKEFILHGQDEFFMVFLNNVCLRPSCYACKYKGVGRYSDITLGDFWGIDYIVSSENDNKGTSLVLVHTKCGETVWNNIQNQCKSRRVDAKDALAYNSAIYHSVKKHPKQAVFISLIDKYKLREAVEKVMKPSITDRIATQIRKVCGGS